MSTRSAYRIAAVVANCPTACAEFYRHWDGYPAIGGAEFAGVLLQSNGDPLQACTLLAAIRRTDGDDKLNATAQYKICNAWDAGDLEWRYAACLTDAAPGGFVVSAAHRSYGMPWAVAFAGTLAEFVDFVNADRNAINARLLQCPPPGFTDASLYKPLAGGKLNGQTLKLVQPAPGSEVAR